jgi:hypothetical protein
LADGLRWALTKRRIFRRFFFGTTVGDREGAGQVFPQQMLAELPRSTQLTFR